MRDFFFRSVKEGEKPDGDAADAALEEDRVQDQTLAEVLRLCVDAESSQEKVPMQVALILQSFLRDAERLDALRSALMEMSDPPSHSRLYSYLKVLCWGLLGEYDSAQRFVADRIFAALTEFGPDSQEFSYFCSLSRVVEYLIDRAAEQQPRGGLIPSPTDKSSIGGGGSKLPDFGPLNTQMVLFGLQAGSDSMSEEKFLVSIAEAFATSESLQEKTQVVRTLLMEFRRSLANYSTRLSVAREYYGEIRAEWVELIQQVYSDWRAPQMDARETIDLIYENIKLSDQLEEYDDVFILQRVLLQIANSSWGNTSSARVAEILFELDPVEFKEISFELARRVNPETSTVDDLESYFSWALKSDSLKMAEAAFVTLSSKSRRDRGCLSFARIQTRHQKFERADYVVRQIQANFLSDPTNLDPVPGLDICLASMEISRDLVLSRQLNCVPIPARPKGIILLTQRTPAEVDKIPVSALLEFRRRGWAVVPLYADVFPYQISGNSLVDDCARVLSTQGLRYEDMRYAEVDDELAEDDLVDGTLTPQFSPEFVEHLDRMTIWDQSTLESRVLSETRAYRRRWHVDPTCPYYRSTLKHSIPMLERLETVLTEFNELGLQNGIKVACLVTGSQSLTDRFCQDFCARDDDPGSLSCLVANVMISSRMPDLEVAAPKKGLHLGPRSNGAHARLRNWGKLNGELTEEASDLAKHFRQKMLSTLQEQYPAINEADLHLDARLALKMVHNWRAKGGNVACVIGESFLSSSTTDSRSPFYKDIKHWLNEVIRIAAKSSTMLILRPCAAENRPPMSKVLNETFSDLVDDRLPDNIVLVQPEWLPLWNLAQRIDLALTYSAEAALEPAILEIPSLSAVGLSGAFPDLGLPLIQHPTELENALQSKHPVPLDADAITRVSLWLNEAVTYGQSLPIQSTARKADGIVDYYSGRDNSIVVSIDEALSEV